MKIKIVDLEIDRGDIYIQAKYDEPIVRTVNAEAGIPRIMSDEAERNSMIYKKEIEIFNKNVKKLHIGDAELIQRDESIYELEEQSKEEKEIEEMKSGESEDTRETEWAFCKVDVHRGCVTIIPNDAICINHDCVHDCVGEYDYISWLEPYKE